MCSFLVYTGNTTLLDHVALTDISFGLSNPYFKGSLFPLELEIPAMFRKKING